MVTADAPASILVVEDNEAIGRGVESALRDAGYIATWCHRGDDALVHLTRMSPNAVVLDVMLPGLDGCALLALIRSRAPQLPVLMISARDAVDDRVQGLSLGADDYLVKPFSLVELVARVGALLRRSTVTAEAERGQATDTTLVVDDLVLDRVARTARRDGRPLQLSAREFDVLALLMRHADTVLSKQTLMREVWKVALRATPIDNLVAVHMARLRKEIDLPGLVPLIHTIRGIGYRLSAKQCSDA